MSRIITNPTKMACAPSEDLDQPGHPPSLIKMMKAWTLSYPLSDSKDSDLSSLGAVVSL